MAYYNTITRQIKGCKRGTLTWYHEYRHYLQDKNGWISVDFWWQFFTIILVVIFWAFSYGNLMMWKFTGVFIVLYLLPSSVLEVDAWIYAFRRKYFRK